MITRRGFLKTGSLALSTLPLLSSEALAGRKRFYPDQILVSDGIKYARKNKKNNVSPILRDEILENPRAVFIIRTDLVMQKNNDGKFPPEKEYFERAGYDTAHKIFRKGAVKGGSTYIKPNFVGFDDDPGLINNGASTHPSFVAGFCDALKELGNTNIVVGVNGAASHQRFKTSGIWDMMRDHGACFIEGGARNKEDFYYNYSRYTKSEITWVEYPEGVVMEKIPFFSPVKEKDTTFINLAKDRMHQPWGMPTLTIKNLQGILPRGYMHVCGGWATGLNRGTEKNVFNPDYRREVEQLYIKHARMGFKYWDEGGFVRDYYKAGGYEAFINGTFKADYKLFWAEQWSQRMMDIISNVTPYVNLVEGIVGIAGDGKLHLNNFITVSCSMVECDSVTTWLMGHDPREMPFLRIANERGLGQNDIEKVSIFEITGNGGIERVRDYRTLERSRIGAQVYGIKGEPLKFF